MHACLFVIMTRYGGQTLGGVETLSRRSLYLEEAVGYFPEEARSLSELHPLEQTSKSGEPATQVSTSCIQYRNSSSIWPSNV